MVYSHFPNSSGTLGPIRIKVYGKNVTVGGVPF